MQKPRNAFWEMPRDLQFKRWIPPVMFLTPSAMALGCMPTWRTDWTLFLIKY